MIWIDISYKNTEIYSKLNLQMNANYNTNKTENLNVKKSRQAHLY